MRKRSYGVLLILLLLSSSVELTAQKVEVGLFAGGSFWSRPGFSVPTIANEGDTPSLTRIDYIFADGGIFGVRVRENLTNSIGLEQSYHWTGTNNAVFQPVAVGVRTHALYFNGVWTALSSERRVRPYISAGFGWSYFNPTEEGKQEAAQILTPAGQLFFNSTSTTAFNFGAGVKWRLTRRLGLDFSYRDFVLHSPTFDIPGTVNRDLDNNTQIQAGLNMLFGGGRPLLVHNFTVAPAIEASSMSMCPGESSTLRIAASDNIAGNDITYKWTSMGRQVSTDPTYTFVAPANAGPYDVNATVYYDTGTLTKQEQEAVKKNRGVPVDRKITLNVKEYREPTASATVERPVVQRNELDRLTGTGTGSECSGNLAYRWSSSDGRLVASADPRSVEFDGSTLAFSDTIQGQQCKPVTVTLEVSDQRGGVARDAKNIQVCYTAPPVAAPPPPPPPPPAPVQLSDINFGLNSARVNNCAKRVLGNELYPQLTSARYSNYDVVLIGHRDPSEKEVTGKKPALSTLSRDRALNAAAYLTAGGATCKDLEITRVRAAWVGTDENSPYRSNFCDGSTVAMRNAGSSADDKVKDRRVEVWLVPKGSSIANMGSLFAATDDITVLGCPK